MYPDFHTHQNSPHNPIESRAEYVEGLCMVCGEDAEKNKLAGQDVCNECAKKIIADLIDDYGDIFDPETMRVTKTTTIKHLVQCEIEDKHNELLEAWK